MATEQRSWKDFSVDGYLVRVSRGDRVNDYRAKLLLPGIGLIQEEGGPTAMHALLTLVDKLAKGIGTGDRALARKIAVAVGLPPPPP